MNQIQINTYKLDNISAEEIGTMIHMITSYILYVVCAFPGNKGKTFAELRTDYISEFKVLDAITLYVWSEEMKNILQNECIARLNGES